MRAGYDEDFYDALRSHSATTGGSVGETDPDEALCEENWESRDRFE